ncbi:MAG: T9SS type A sorting domain-containing protein, partial [Cyclobacteriaceae bacterium]|nr:T9SS type A sorting domain-containing protein [Cyclobacteriaceae bacterium]
QKIDLAVMMLGSNDRQPIRDGGQSVEVLSERWKELRNGPYQTAVMHQYIDSVYQVLNQEAQQRNFQRWPVLGEYVWPNYYIGQTYQQEVVWLKNWITERMNWLDENLSLLITSIEEDPSILHLKVYPNPVSDRLTLEYRPYRNEPVAVTMSTNQGQVLSEHLEYPQKDGIVRHTVDLGTYPEGMYLLTVTTKSGIRYTRKVIRTR